MNKRLAPLLLVGLLACAHTSNLEAGLRELRATTQLARERGAYRCAPEELALSEAHLEFAAHELEQGDTGRARHHLVLAASNARAALRLSGDRACAAVRAGAPEANAWQRAKSGRRVASEDTEPSTMLRGSAKQHAAI